jgi:N-formylglutamate deformylase
MEAFKYYAGTIPLVVSIPHCGTYVPPAILDRFVEPAKRLPDTDWHVERLYDFVREMGAHLLVATHSRYVNDLNRAPDDASLYPGKFTTGLCPLTLFDGSPLYREGQAPDAAEIEERKEKYWKPYHAKLQELLQAHDRIVLLDAHSIASQVPTLFDGILPDLNLGTAEGASCDPQLAAALEQVCANSGYIYVHNGRFKGGYITRHYGNPAAGIHAVQLELSQRHYMQEQHPFTYNEAKAIQLQRCLQNFMSEMVKYLAGHTG